MEGEIFVAILAMLLVGLIGVHAYLYNLLWLEPKRLRSKLESQGITGPSPVLLYGNIPQMKRIQLQFLRRHHGCRCHRQQGTDGVTHDWPAAMFPYMEQWRKDYGAVFVYSTGNIPVLCIIDPEMAKEVSLCTSLSLGKPSYLSKERGPLLGQGILSSNGPYWAHQRRIIAPEFYPDKVKGMVNLMADSTTSMLNSWEKKIETEGGLLEIAVDEELRALSADIISRACFGSNFSQGEKIFSGLRTLQNIMSKTIPGIPGSRYLPSKNNREIWRLEKNIYSMILGIIKARGEETRENNLLRMILKAAKSCGGNSTGLNIDVSLEKFVVDNCKNIYFAGHETTAISASWCLMLLAMYPEWQDRVRSEVLEICAGNLPDAAMLRNMKTLNMVIQEALRLYPPVAYVVREALKEISFKGIQIPKGMNLQIVMAFLHQEQGLWGADSHHFRPERFENGAAGACKIPQLYLPFGIGPRTCAGQHFAIAELRVILSLIISRFSFSLSPAYEHSPVFRLVIEPENGVKLLFKKV